MIQKAIILEGHDWRHEHAAMAAVWMPIYTRGNDVGDPDYWCGFPERRELEPSTDADCFVVADVELADGSRLIGTVAPAGNDAAQRIYALTVCFWSDGRSANASVHAADDHPSDPPERRDHEHRLGTGRAWLLAALGRDAKAVFPLTITPRVPIIGWERSWTVADVLPGRGMKWSASDRPHLSSSVP